MTCVGGGGDGQCGSVVDTINLRIEFQVYLRSEEEEEGSRAEPQSWTRCKALQ